MLSSFFQKDDFLDVGDTLRYLKRLGEQYPIDFIKKATDDVYERSIKNAKKHTDSGRMHTNISKKVKKTDTSGTVWIRNDGMKKTWRGRSVNYGIFVHFGSNPHKILPKNKKSLRWASDGKKYRSNKRKENGFYFIHSKGVNHPGYKCDPFMYNALDKTRSIIDKIAKEAANGY